MNVHRKDLDHGGVLRTVNAVAPIRICDIGGWTDTWFARRGTIFNIAVYPYVEVQDRQYDRSSGGSISIQLENYNQSYTLKPGGITYGAHPLIDAAVDTVGLPTDISLDVNIFSHAPPGASTGTSSAMTVALIAALSRIAGRHLTTYEFGSMAHSVETEKLKLQCGIQDQMASAYGGINFIQMHQFPHASVSQLQVPNPLWWELESRLSLVYIGTPHTSSEVHQKVIAGLGGEAENDPRLEELRRLAGEAKQALLQGDFPAFGSAMDRNTDAQRRLNKGLVCGRFETAIEAAKRFGALGCKVNGAGGDGGSLTILGDGDSSRKRRMLESLQKEDLIPVPIYLSRFGARVW